MRYYELTYFSAPQLLILRRTLVPFIKFNSGNIDIHEVCEAFSLDLLYQLTCSNNIEDLLVHAAREVWAKLFGR